MTKISRSIEMRVDPDTVWEFMDMRKWTQFSEIFKKIDLSSAEMKVGEIATITAGPGSEDVRYSAQITAFEPMKKLAYSRSGGPLPGKSEWQILANGTGSKVSFENTFRDPLPEPVEKSMASTMEKFLSDMKSAAEIAFGKP
ncbi:MAG: SRPBCC family protein [Deferribacteres bacterium]|nr:SRPBCC family protein [candidate division KSB1 bacterium]MCB9510712.1 SRPBCC family protein [Deferribacteres bacterium]